MAKRPQSALVPAAARPDLQLTPLESDLSAAAIDAFTVAIGGRDALLHALIIADTTPDVQKVTNLLIDPRYGGWSLRRICHHAGLTIADLFTAYRKALLVKAHLEATRIVSDRLVKVVEDVMARAQVHELTCESCGGVGQVTPEPSKKNPNPGPEACRTCRGKGRITVYPDLDRQKVALELGQLLQRSGGISIAQNNLHMPIGGGPVNAPGALEQLQQAVHGVLYPRRTVEEPSAAATTVLDGETIAEANEGGAGA